MANDTVTVSDNQFKQEVLDSSQPVLVDFWAAWCQPCRAIAPMVDELATTYKGRVKVAKVDVDEAQNVAQQFNIMSIPTLLVFKGGRVVQQFVGAPGRGKLEEALNKALTS